MWETRVQSVGRQGPLGKGMATHPSGGFPGGASGKRTRLPVQVDVRDVALIPGSGRVPWRRKWQPTPDFSPEKSHGLRNLVGYGPWRVEQDLETKQLLPLVVMYILQEELRDGVEIQKL